MALDQCHDRRGTGLGCVGSGCYRRRSPYHPPDQHVDSDRGSIWTTRSNCGSRSPASAVCDGGSPARGCAVGGSAVVGAESTARCRYVQLPATLIYAHPLSKNHWTPEFAPKALIQKGRIMLDPAPDGDVIHGQAALRHDFFQIPVAERIPQVPPHAKHDNDIGKVSPAERRWSGSVHGITVTKAQPPFATDPLGALF